MRGVNPARLAAWVSGPGVFEAYIRRQDVARDNRPPEELTPDELRARIVRQSRKIVRECDQVIADCESWADNRPDEEPLDFEWARVWRAQAAGVLRQLGEPLEG